MKKIAVFTLLLWLCIPAANAQVFSVEDIRIEGLQRVSPGSVFASVPFQVGDLVDEGIVQDTVRALFRTGFFQDIVVFRDGNVLVVQVEERPAIAALNLEGNKLIDDDSLLASLRDNGLSEGQIFKPETLDGLSRSLSREYVAQGHYGSVIDTRVRDLPRNRVAVDINIDEGKKAKIKEIKVIGNKEFSDKKLEELFELGTTNYLSWLTGNDKYSREKLSGDLERIESYYLDRGYVRFAIDSTQVSVSPDRKSVYITVNVNEGKQYTIDEIGMLGDLVVSENRLRRLLRVRSGQLFSQAAITGTKDLITRVMSNEGYAFAEVDELVDISDEDNTVDLNFFVDPKKRVYVRRVEFRGNTRTDDEVLRREMRQLESAVASNALIDSGEVRLNRLGFFSEISSETIPVPGTSDQVDVIYSVREQTSGSISASLGFAQNTGAILGLNLQENNFLGTGNRVGVGINRSSFQESINFSFTDPYFTPDGVSAGYSAFFRRTDFGDFEVASFSTDSLGFNVNFGYPLSEVSRLNFGFGYENLRVGVGDQASGEIEEFAEDGETFNQFKSTVTWLRSTLNRGVFATRGSRQQVSLEVAAPGSDAPFYKLNINAEKLIPLGAGFTFKVSTDLGFGDSLEDNRLPFFENYFAGGFGSVRGFELNTLGPRETLASFIDEDGNLSFFETEPDPIGGNVLITGSAEILLPLPFIPSSQAVQATVFLDAGNVFDTNCGEFQVGCFSPDLGEIRYSYGVGFTWLSGFGPLSFALGSAQNAGPLEETEFFQFSIGQTF